MKDYTTTYRVTIDIKTTSNRNTLRKWVSDTIQDKLDTEYGEEIVEIYVDEWRG
jgi:hypothetical protein